MSMKLENKDSTEADKDPFSQLGLALERVIRKKKSPNDDDTQQLNPDADKKSNTPGGPEKSKGNNAAAASVMSHWSDEREPIDTLTTADRMRKQDKRRIINDPKSSDKNDSAKANEPSKAQSVE